MTGKCSSCGGRGHVQEMWRDGHWITVRACGACGMRGERGEFARENDARLVERLDRAASVGMRT